MQKEWENIIPLGINKVFLILDAAESGSWPAGLLHTQLSVINHFKRRPSVLIVRQDVLHVQCRFCQLRCPHAGRDLQTGKTGAQVSPAVRKLKSNLGQLHSVLTIDE